MANTLTNLIPDIYAALDTVTREMVGYIPNVARDPVADRVAVGQTLRIEVTPSNVAGKDTTPAMAFPAAADQVIGNKTVTINKSRAYPFSWSGEEQYAVNKGPGYLTIRQDQIAQAIRALVNEMETDIAIAAYKNASRAFGTAGTAPFATDLSDLANIKKILDDNGAPDSDRHLVINSTAGLNLLKQTQLTYVNQAGSDATLRRGILLDLLGFSIHESAQVPVVTKGAGSAYVTSGSTAVGVTDVALVTGSGTVLAGDVVTFAADTSNKYVVAVGVAAPGTISLAKPGARVVIPTGNAMTIGNNFTANVAFRRNAILLATRLPMVPAEGDLATDRVTITDPMTGISFEFATYPGYRMNEYEVSCAWGVSGIKSEQIAILLG